MCLSEHLQSKAAYWLGIHPAVKELFIYTKGAMINVVWTILQRALIFTEVFYELFKNYAKYKRP